MSLADTDAVARTGIQPYRLPSGAGHDGLAEPVHELAGDGVLQVSRTLQRDPARHDARGSVRLSMGRVRTTIALVLCCGVGVTLSMLDHHLLNGMLNDASFGLLMGAYAAGIVTGRIHS